MRVPTPEVNSVTEVSRPTRNGTSTVAPNMAKRCWSESGSDCSKGSRSFTSMVRVRMAIPSDDDEVHEEGEGGRVHERRHLLRAPRERLEEHVGDEARADAVRDAVGERHHGDDEERRDGLRRVVPR